MNPAVGVDLGTTNTVVAIQTDATGPRILEIPQPGDERNVFEVKDHIKSAVFFESADQAVVGSFAARRIGSFRSIKSRMGSRVASASGRPARRILLCAAPTSYGTRYQVQRNSASS